MPAKPPQSANPLFLSWVKEWDDHARDTGRQSRSVFRMAYASLRDCPIAFDHPAQLHQLRGFGPVLCTRLTNRLQKHCAENDLPMPEIPGTRPRDGGGGEDDNSESGEEEEKKKKQKKTRKPRAYVPQFRSGGYALILGLSSATAAAAASGMPKAELINVSQPHSDTSFSAAKDPTRFQTAWSAMKTLVQRELVVERGRPTRQYSLTDEGWDVARRIRATPQFKASLRAQGGGGEEEEEGEGAEEGSERDGGHNEAGSGADPRPGDGNHDDDNNDNDNDNDDGDDDGKPLVLPSFKPIILPPGSFTVRLVLDVREIRSTTDRDYMRQELTKKGVTPIMRSLALGDAQWVAKVTDPDLLRRLGDEGDEVVLDWIVERKRFDDLISSIRDGRLREQKFRLARSAVRRVVYVIEGDASTDSRTEQQWGDRARSAIASTSVVSGFFVRQTANMDDTIRYLVRMTALLEARYAPRALRVIPSRILTTRNYAPLILRSRQRSDGGGGDGGVDHDDTAGCYVTYAAFASIASKSDTRTLRDVFLRMLMNSRGITGARAIEIQRRWKTPRAFIDALAQHGADEAGHKRKRDMLADQLAGEVGSRKFPRAVADKLADLWGGHTET